MKSPERGKSSDADHEHDRLEFQISFPLNVSFFDLQTSNLHNSDMEWLPDLFRRSVQKVQQNTYRINDSILIFYGINYFSRERVTCLQRFPEKIR